MYMTIKPGRRLGSMVLLLQLLLVFGCAAPVRGQSSGALAPTLCENPRPQICTREYNPVCALSGDQQQKTYATGCTACADAEVISWLGGACPEQD